MPRADPNIPTSCRVAIVGAGIGAQHLEGYMSLQDLFSVKYLCDVDCQRASRAISDHGAHGTEHVADLDSVLADKDIDMVDVCLPPHMHLDAIASTLAAGKHVTCEKPLVLSLAELDQVELMAKNAGKVVFPVFQYRFHPGPLRMAALMGSGIAGRVLTVALETHWNRGPDYYASPWRGKRRYEGGGAILGHAIHTHDLLDTLLGPVVSVQAVTDTRVNDIEVEDCAAVAFRLQCGAPASSSITLGANDDTSRFRACFENATVESGTDASHRLDDWKFLERGQQSASIAAAASIPSGAKLGYAGFFCEVHKALSGEQSNVPTLADARMSIGIISAIYESAQSGRSVGLPVTSSSPFYTSMRPGN